jgi:predicted transcriptional regulator|tara:strand:+ start:906 stop:1160 length:255 start_codon:yes stop_codon:yes gene_type:complete
MNWELYAWLKRGNRRKEVLKVIASSNTPLTVNEIKTKVKIAMAQASFTVKELLNKRLIDCLNPNDKIGKLYKINKGGRDLLNEI